MVLYSLSRKTHFEKGELSKLHEALTFVGIDESDGTLLAAVFKQMDLTDSGVETGQVNFSHAASFFGDPTLSPEECTELVDTIFKEHDTDGTGSLSYKQYMSAIVANPILTSFVSGQGKGPVSQASIKDLPADLPEAAPEADGPAPAPEEAAAYAAAPAPAA
ncbi:protein serine/threonine phosphatase [Aureococcus anophagefferens]|nr:protein serine/threonine phosphatase [Aureococcus anophagefferens]